MWGCTESKLQAPFYRDPPAVGRGSSVAVRRSGARGMQGRKACLEQGVHWSTKAFAQSSADSWDLSLLTRQRAMDIPLHRIDGARAYGGKQMGGVHRSAPGEGAGAQPCLSAADAREVADDETNIVQKEHQAKARAAEVADPDLPNRSKRKAIDQKQLKNAMALGCERQNKRRMIYRLSPGMGVKKTEVFFT